ncbi:uncharacterized protein IL334_003567 [Kwoniella shivajii]|uniref:AGC protein kinase n=1 Tax=Kwoniella shivajii TaxID=564305 RepID=A0ABZ1CXY3_9TREE|nr:hypothetical protein IL334_003567 [Kwoniella shivajii]
MVKSQRSSNTLFHQWPNNHNNNRSEADPKTHLPSTPNHHLHSRQKDNESISIRMNDGSDSTRKSGFGDKSQVKVNRANANVNVNGIDNGPSPITGFNPYYTPGSPSQIDPFGSQVTSPTPVQLPQHPTSISNTHSKSNSNANTNTNTNRSRPPSTVLSSGGSPLPGSNSNSVTPKIILASPSTSTIHYLFPSSDTKNGIHLSTTTTTATTTATGDGEGHRKNDSEVKVKRTQSLSRGNSIKTKNLIISNSKHEQYRDIPGLKNKRSLPKQSQSQSQSLSQNPNNPNFNETKSNQITFSSVKKSDISQPIPSSLDEARDYSKGYYDIKPGVSGADEMGTLRRQPGMVDLSGKSKVGPSDKTSTVQSGPLKRRESIILREIENRRERRGWEFGSKPTYANEPVEPSSPRSKTILTTNTKSQNIRGPIQRPYIPPITIIQQRRRSQSMTSQMSSPRPAPSPPIDPAKSPLLPAPDLGDPLSLSVVIPSPSYSHLDYSPAGSGCVSTTNTSSFRQSKGWARRTSAIFPLSVAMSRGDTRKGLGGYDEPKNKVQEDMEKRKALEGNGTESKFASLKRSISLRKKTYLTYEEHNRKIRPRSQSLSARSIKGREEASPLPSPSIIPSMMKAGLPNLSSNLYLDERYSNDLSIDLGSRYYQDYDNTPSTIDLISPKSQDSSLLPASTPTSATSSSSEYPSFSNAEKSSASNGVIKIIGRPLHPAFNGNGNESESDLSILAPSTVGLGFSPIGTPGSLPDSLLEEAIDLTGTGRRMSDSPMIESVITPPTPRNQGILPNPGVLHMNEHYPDTSKNFNNGMGTQKIPRRSVLLAQNRFYIPPSHQKSSPSPQPQTQIQKKPSLRSSRSLGPGTMEDAYGSTHIRCENRTPTATSTSFGRGLLKSASIRSSNRRFSKVSVHENDEKSPTNQIHYGTERIPASSSMRFHRRPLTTFSICSPSDAIDPLPPHTASPHPSSEHNHRNESRTTRSNRSSPFLSASNSLRVIFGKEGFMARSLSHAFEKDPQNQQIQSQNYDQNQTRQRFTSASIGEKQGLKSKISSPLEASMSNKNRERSLSPPCQLDAAEKRGRNADKKWRESVLQEALSTSISSSSLNKLADSPMMTHLNDAEHTQTETQTQPRPEPQQRMVSSGSKSRLAIPDKLLEAPDIRESTCSESFKGIGESMLNMNMNGSLESGVNLRAVMENWELPLPRNLGMIGKEESLVSAPSMYSNNASTLFEKPTRRLQGKGFPSSFSTADLSKRSSSSNNNDKSPISLKYRNPSISKGESSKSHDKLKTRMPRPPVPISSPSTYDDRFQTFDLHSNTHTDQTALMKSPHIHLAEGRSVSPETPKGRIPSSRSSIFGLKSKVPKAENSSSAMQGVSKSSFGLSLRSSIRSRSTSRSRLPVSSAGNGVSSSDIPVVAEPVLNALLARETPVAGIGGDKDKVRKVLEWRDEVGENGELAKLEDRMRGFVSEERERVRVIGRKSIEGDYSINFGSA